MIIENIQYWLWTGVGLQQSMIISSYYSCSHGIIFRYEAEVEDNNGTALVSVSDEDWMGTVMNSPHIVWCICTNCSSFFENMSAYLRGCYSLHFILSCSQM
jgi:hypothetical protein